MKKKRNAYRNFLRKPKEKGRIGRTKCRWENNIEKDLKVMGSETNLD
jgi:hypothetical protein